MVESWFPIPIYCNGIQGDAFNSVQTELSNIIELQSFQPKWNTHMLSDPTFTENLLIKYSADKFLEQIDLHIKEYSSAIGYNKSPVYSVIESWATKFQKGMYGHIHTHKDSDISGVYYFETNEKDGNLFFESPVKQMNASYFTKDIPTRASFSPQVGKLLLFPGWLSHGVETNTTDTDRISISFNIVFEKYGMKL